MSSYNQAMPRRNVFDQLDPGTILKDYQAGMTGAMVATKYGVSVGYVYSLLKQHGIEPHFGCRDGNPTRRPSGRRSVADSDIPRILKLGRDGVPYATIARRFGITHEWVRQLCFQAGQPPRAIERAARKARRLAGLAAKREEARLEREARRRVPSARIRSISNLWMRGLTLAQIADELDTSSNCIGVKIVHARKRFPDLFPYRHEGYGQNLNAG